MEAVRQRLGVKNIYILGEIYGQGVQDLNYNAKESQFRVFDIYCGEPGGDGRYLAFAEMRRVVDGIFETVPVVFYDYFTKEALTEHTIGQSTLADHVREGVVVRPQLEGHDEQIGRRILKSVSEEYSLRKGKKTEYQ